MMQFDVSGLDEAIAHLERMRDGSDTVLAERIHERGEATALRFIGCTPRDTGLTGDDWKAEDRGLLEVGVVNRRKTNRGFLVASALLTGTGDRGAGATPAAGYAGGFTPGWHGMYPSATLQPAWNDEASTSLATPVLIGKLTA